MRLLHTIVLALALVAPASAMGAYNTPTNALPFTNSASVNVYNMLEGVALNAAAGTRTMTLKLQKAWRKVKVNVFYTYSAATAVTVTMSCSIDGTNYGTVQSRSISAGSSTVSDVVDSKTSGAASQSYQLEYDVEGCENAKWVFGGTSAGGGDLVSVQAVAISVG